MTTSAETLLAAFRAYLQGFDAPILAGFLDGLDWSMPERALPPRPLPCLDHLGRLAATAGGGAEGLARLLALDGRALHWGQTYSAADFGQNFIDNYGWLEMFGTRGHFANDRIAAGFLILGPGIHYPDHHHVAEEIYIPLTPSTEWRKGIGAFETRAAGEIIHHPSGINHAMRTGADPLLALYLWRGGPLDQKSTISATE